MSKELGGDYLTAGEAARLLHVTTRTVDRWADMGLIPCLVTLGGHRRFERSRIEAILHDMGHRNTEGLPDKTA